MRARLNVLTELPEEWEAHLDRWLSWNAEKKIAVKGALAPASGEEILIYQTLLGAWPNEPEEEKGFAERTKEFITKAMREAKQNSSWIAPDEAYEQAVKGFIDRILEEDSRFLPDFRQFQKQLAVCGARNGLSQVLLKVACPGVPDFYQGTELWQFTLVDPDNRRPVDYSRRISMLDTLRRREAEDRIALIRELAVDPARDEMKLFATHKALDFRRSHKELFAQGRYIPLAARGACAAHVCAFARQWESQWAVVVAPRWLVHLADWADTELVIPDGWPMEWEDALTGLIPASWRLGALLCEFPIALLFGQAG
jgi:(1->4)-alpha-D-glucan 1-alpha-D-glucosylmutase